MRDSKDELMLDLRSLGFDADVMDAAATGKCNAALMVGWVGCLCVIFTLKK